MKEQLRHYYLNTMGIQPWLLREKNTPKIELLYKEVSQCQSCELHKTRSQVVFGVGNVDADLMIIGEAPGYHEDKQGKPFVGRAGQLLSSMLSSIGIQRDSVYIANVLKCRPPNNRDPKLEEIIHCSKHLSQQIACIQPKLILALGKHAANYLLDTQQPLYKLRTQLHDYNGINVLVSYHPAYLLRNPSDKSKAYTDLIKISELLKGDISNE
jgi:uracil-DNA glycosylase family 4